MKAPNKIYLLLIVLVMVISTLACVSEPVRVAPKGEESPRGPLIDPTRVPTQKVDGGIGKAPTPKPPIEQYCLTGDDLATLTRSASDIRPSFVPGTDWQWESVDMSLPNYMMGLMYETDSDGCLLALTAVIVNDWYVGDPDLSGQYMGIVTGVSDDDQLVTLIANNLDNCINSSVDKKVTTKDGGVGVFTCIDEGDYYTAAVMYIFP